MGGTYVKSDGLQPASEAECGTCHTGLHRHGPVELALCGSGRATEIVKRMRGNDRQWTEKSSVIFGNPMPDKVYRKGGEVRKRNMRKNSGTMPGADYPVAVEKNRYIGIHLAVYNVLVGNPQRMYIRDGRCTCGEKVAFDTEKGNHRRQHPHGIRTLPHFDGDGVCGDRRWVIRLTGWT